MAQAQKSETETKTVTGVGPVVEAGSETTKENRALSTGEQEDLVADKDEDEVKGSVYYILLDEQGTPTGTVQDKIPEAGVPYITAYGVNTFKPEVLSTPSGAPLTKNMNPEHSHRDPGLEARNPIPGAKRVEVGDTVTTKDKKTVVTEAKTGK